MKQGRATHSGSGSTKVEPRSHAVPAAYPSRLGVMQGNHAMEGGTFNKVRREMASDLQNKWDHTRQLPAPTHEVKNVTRTSDQFEIRRD